MAGILNIRSEQFPPNYDYKSQPDCTDLDHIPGNFGLPFLGHFIGFVKDLRGLSDSLFKRYGPLCKFNLAGSKGIFVHNPDVIQEIFLDKYQNFSNEKAFENTLGRFFDGGLLLRDFDEHKAQRRIFQSAFKNDAMRDYVNTMNVIMAEHINSWDGKSDFRLYPHIKSCLLSTSAKIFIGVENDKELQYLNKNFVDMFEGMVGIIQKEIPGTKWHRAKRALRNLKSHYESLIPSRRANDGKDFLSYLSKEKKEDGSYFSDEDIVNHINFLLMAAHDTTTSSITNILFELGKNPAWQERLREQVFSLDKAFIEYDDLEQLTDIENAILEAQRLHPSVPISGRRSIRECEIEGYRIPPNTLIWMPLLQNYRSSKWFTDPEKFNPDRFSPESAEHKNHNFAFVPFGGGSHKCIGMHFAKIQVKCFLHQFLRTYRFSIPDNYAPKLMLIPMPKPMDNLPMTLERL